MSFYDEVGIRPFINAGGWMYTRYGGTIMPDIVVAAMAEASKHFVNLFELQDQVGPPSLLSLQRGCLCLLRRRIGHPAVLLPPSRAPMPKRLPVFPTRAGYAISSSCGAVDVIRRPISVIRAAGGRIIFVGPADRFAAPEEIFAAINEQTAAIVLVELESEGQTDSASVIAGGRERGIPVIIDGACSVPPRKNLWHYTRDLGETRLSPAAAKRSMVRNPPALYLANRG